MSKRKVNAKIQKEMERHYTPPRSFLEIVYIGDWYAIYLDGELIRYDPIDEKYIAGFILGFRTGRDFAYSVVRTHHCKDEWIVEHANNPPPWYVIHEKLCDTATIAEE